MEDENMSIKEEIEEGRFEYGFIKVIPCTNKENKEYEKMVEAGQKLPDGILAYTYCDGERTGEYYTVYEEELTDSERMEYLAYRKLSLLRTIRNCIIGLLALSFVLLIVSFVILAKTSSIYNDIEAVKEGVKIFI